MKNNNLASNLRVLRYYKHYSQSYLAQKLGVSQPDYSNIENGKTGICPKKEKVIEEIYEISIADLTIFTEDEALEYIINKKRQLI
jgi:hypothetical protein